MVLLTLCIPCQHGNHDDHMEVIQAAPPGMMGGARCPCKGDCRGRRVDRVGTVRICENCDRHLSDHVSGRLRQCPDLSGNTYKGPA